MVTTIVLIILIVTGLIAVIILPQILLRRAMKTIIRTFRRHDAAGINNAKIIEELGLIHKGGPLLFRQNKYMLPALEALINADIIQTTEDGKMYLSEEDLAKSKWGDKDLE